MTTDHQLLFSPLFSSIYIGALEQDFEGVSLLSNEVIKIEIFFRTPNEENLSRPRQRTRRRSYGFQARKNIDSENTPHLYHPNSIEDDGSNSSGGAM